MDDKEFLLEAYLATLTEEEQAEFWQYEEKLRRLEEQEAAADSQRRKRGKHMQQGEIVTIHTYTKAWKQAKITAIGTDTLDGTRPVFIVEHPNFPDKMDFYVQADSHFRHYHPGDAGFWIEEE